MKSLIDNIHRHSNIGDFEDFRGVFVAKLDLRPAPNGWAGSVVFRRYEYKPPRR